MKAHLKLQRHPSTQVRMSFYDRTSTSDPSNDEFDSDALTRSGYPLTIIVLATSLFEDKMRDGYKSVVFVLKDELNPFQKVQNHCFIWGLAILLSRFFRFRGDVPPKRRLSPYIWPFSR